MIRVVFETHSTSVDNERGIATGWLPGELSDTGRTQAAQLGERRRDDGIDLVVCSDLRRAVETVELAFAGSPLPIRYDARLRECNYGDWNGMPRARLEAERVARIDVPFPGGESRREAVQRHAGFLRNSRPNAIWARAARRARRDALGARPRPRRRPPRAARRRDVPSGRKAGNTCSLRTPTRARSRA